MWTLEVTIFTHNNNVIGFIWFGCSGNIFTNGDITSIANINVN